MTSDTGEREETMSLSDQICKAEALWALKTAKDNFSFHASDGFHNYYRECAQTLK